MEKILIAAIADNRVIGYRNKIPWPKIPEDMKHFRDLTMGHLVAMGRKTFESIKSPLEGRTKVVLTRDGVFLDEGVITCHSIEEIIKYTKSLTAPKIFFAGGADVYRQVIGIVDKMEWTRIYGTYKGDAFFPEVNLNAWEEVGRQDFPRSDNLPAFSFLSYRRL